MAFLKIVDVTKVFGDFTAVRNVNLNVEEGESVGIIGPNGAGKTTLLNIITGRYIPESGSVYFKKKDITHLRPEKRVNMGILRTFQLVHVFDNLSVYKNLALSIYRKEQARLFPPSIFFKTLYYAGTREKVSQSLRVFDLMTERNEMAGSLSLGSKKKLELAMACIADPAILLLDEPFAGLGDQEIDEILDILKAYKQGKTVVVIEHKISKLTQVVDRLAVMHEGEIIACGPCEETLNHPEVRKSYWKIS